MCARRSFCPALAATLFGTFGAMGLVLAAVGLYGVMSFSVSRRVREIGIRMALGAKPGSVERLVLRQGLVLTLIAIALGWPAAWMLAKMASSFLYGIRPHDALTFTSRSTLPCPGRIGGVLLPCAPRGFRRTDAGFAH